MVRHPGLRAGRDRLQEGEEPRRPVRRAAPLATDAAQRRIQTEKMRAGFPPRPQHGRDQQSAKPGLSFERRVSVPGIPQKRRSQQRRFGLGYRGGAAPDLQPFAFLAVWIIDQRITLGPHAVGKNPVAALERAVERGEFACERVVVRLSGRALRLIFLTIFGPLLAPLPCYTLRPCLA